MSIELINRVVELTNIERAKVGLQPLTLNLQLANAAQDHSRSMAQDDFFSHTGADGSTVGSRVQDNGYQYANAGENIAVGQTTAEQVVASWMNSPGHRANILNENYTEIGIGYEYLADDTGSVNYNHYWTQVFGRPLNNTSGNVSPAPVSSTNTPEPLEEIASAEQSNTIEDTSNSSDSDRLSVVPEIEPDLEAAERLVEVEEVVENSTLEDNNDSNIEQSDLALEPQLEVEQDNSPEVLDSIENGALAIPVENMDNSLEIDELAALELEYTGDLNGTADSILTGGDAFSSFVYVESSTSTSSNDVKFDYAGEGSKSWLGLAAEAHTNLDLADLFEDSFSYGWTEEKQSVLQQIAESFL